MTEDLYQFVVCDYSATGEGMTKMIMITRAYPREDDYETPGSYNYETQEYTPPTLKPNRTAAVRAIREFAERFDGYYARGAECIDRETFFDLYDSYLPKFVKRMLEDPDQPGNFNFQQQIHMNFS